jgi:hypothetical protein
LSRVAQNQVKEAVPSCHVDGKGEVSESLVEALNRKGKGKVHELSEDEVPFDAMNEDKSWL